MRHNRSHTPIHTIAIATLLAALASNSVADAQQKSPLKEHYVLGRIRVFYTNAGVPAVAPVDVDKNSVPDQVENVAKQVWAAHHLFCEVLEFPDPFESERYKGVTCVQVSIRDRAEMGGPNGVAYTSSQRARQIPEGKPGDRAIVMAIAKQLDPITNISPAHETFHLIQYGTTYFKTPGFLKGRLAGRNMDLQRTESVKSSTLPRDHGRKHLGNSGSCRNWVLNQKLFCGTPLRPVPTQTAGSPTKCWVKNWWHCVIPMDLQS